MDKFLRVLFGYIFLGLSLIECVEVNILKTRGQLELSWATHTSNATASSRGWRESSDIPDGNRINSICNIAGDAVDNWLRTPFIPRGHANRLHIEIEFTMRTCDLFPDPVALQQCKESFKLLYFEAESDFANEMRPTWDTLTYTHEDVIAADETFSGPSDSVVNKEVRSIPVTKNGVYFAFLDQGACVSLMSVRIYHIICPEIIEGFAFFPNTTTSAEPADVVPRDGECVEHAVIERQPRYLCGSNGRWQIRTGQCSCMPGYSPASATNDRQCHACAPGTYKWLTGSESCRECPPHSEAPSHGAVECSCVADYFRKHDDDKSWQCTRPPSEPTDLHYLYVDTTSMNVTWSQPSDLGGRRDLTYRVMIFASHAVTPTYRPRQSGFNTTSVEISGLWPGTQYRVVVYAENGVSDQATHERKDSIYVYTQPALPAKVDNVVFLSIQETAITLSWSAPAQSDGQIDMYELQYYPGTATHNISTLQARTNNLTVTGLRPNTDYSFQVRARTSEGWGELSEAATARTGATGQGEGSDSAQADESPERKETSDDGSPVGIIVGSAIAVIVCMFIVIIMVVIFFRRNNGQCNEKGITECDTLAYGNGEVQCQHLVEGSPALNGQLTMPLFTPPGGIKTYVDPHTYEDPNQAVREFTKEIDSSFITIESVIGGGEFGDVCKGRLRIATRGDITVAIKTLKQGASDKNRLDFLTEASIMGQFDDPNVIFLEGVVTKSSPNMIVMEFMEKGALDAYLRHNDGQYSVLQLTGMMRGIASGMRYLADMGFIHRDLAARNILVNDNLVCKVADFGLSREIESDDTSGAYTTKGGKIPVRWTAPEAIAYRKFTSAADVWSYGVVMWEVMSYGERPYWNWSNQDVIKAVDKGFRLPPPMDCPEPLYMLMLDCWQKERNQRPKFNPIVKTLDKLIRSPELLRNIAKQRPHEFINPNKPDLTSYGSVEEWLASIKMEKYVEHFAQAGYRSMEQVAALTLLDLQQRVGVTLVGHQKKIINSVQTLRAHIMPLDPQQISNTFIV